MQKIKCVALGNYVARQTELLIRYTTNKFPSVYVPTVFQNASVDVTIDGELYELNLWSTAGQDDYDRLRPLSFPQTDIFLVLFSVGHPSSLEIALTKFLPEIKHHCPTTPFLLVGTRTDLRNTTEVHDDFTGTSETCLPSKFGSIIANRIGAVLYKECSAFTGEGVKDVMDHAVRAALNLKNIKMSRDKISDHGYPVGMDHEWRDAYTASTVSLFVSTRKIVIINLWLHLVQIQLQCIFLVSV